jgi:hypothetical protein
MRRVLQVAVNYVAPLIVCWLVLTVGGITLQLLSALWLLFIAAAWVAWRMAQAISDVRSMVHDWRARRAADPLDDYGHGGIEIRIGHQPTRVQEAA